MNLKIKIICQPNTEFAKMLANNLLDTVKSIQLIKNGIIIEPNQNEDETYIIPELIDDDNYTLLINANEYGGLNEEDNLAQVVCSSRGKPLKSYFIPSKNVVPCGIHANFSVPISCVTIQARDNNIVIVEGKIEHDFNNHYANLIKTELYNGNIDDLPIELIKFKLAAEVAIDKSNCLQCTHTHYYIDTNQLYTETRKFI